jgi:uncharacterized membrane protein YdjX (TVP38/TMEM64 family)
MKKLILTLINKKIIAIFLAAVFAFAVVLVAIKIGKPLINYISEPEKFREWIDSYGIFSRLIFVALVVLQVVVAIIPGEPFEIAAGYIFGAVEGTILSIIGTLIGSVIVFWFVRVFGVKFVEIFYSREKINSLKFLKNTKKLTLITYIVFLIPGTPKDLLTYFVGLTNIKFSSWVFIASVARLPSIVTSTVGGDALGVKKYELAIIVFAITIFISVVGMIIYNEISKSKKA